MPINSNAKGKRGELEIVDCVSFFASGTPKPQPRVRAYRRGAHASVYDPGTADNWKRAISIAYKAARPRGFSGFSGPVTMSLVFQMPRPKSHFGTGKNSGNLKTGCGMIHSSKPDLDNLIKAVKDALTSASAWRDDSQVCCITASKRYSERVGCDVLICAV